MKDVQDKAEKAVAAIVDPPVYSEWMAEEFRENDPQNGWKNAIYRLNGTVIADILRCPHKHKTAAAAHACAMKAVRARNLSNSPMADGWSDARPYPWSDERVRALVDDVTGHAGPIPPKG